jgi:ActR/RegA family two-component response regulator
MSGNRGLLMIVEEDHAPCRDPHRLMPERGWGTCLATTATEALGLLDAGLRPDCLVLPMRRPDEGGAAVLRKVREAGSSTRVAICAGPAGVEDMEGLRALRPDLLLVRPIDADAVAEAASRVRGGGGLVASGRSTSRESRGNPPGRPRPEDIRHPVRGRN